MLRILVFTVIAAACFLVTAPAYAKSELEKPASQEALAAEATARAAADTAEATARAAADTAEATARAAAILQLQAEDAVEAAARTEKDNALMGMDISLQDQIDGLLARIEALEDEMDGVMDDMEPKTVFISSLTYDGDIGGLDGADYECQSLADDAGLEGTYKAWLSDEAQSPSTRFTHAMGPYVRVDGETVADNWTDLITCTLGGDCLQNAIVVDETGQNHLFDPLDVFSHAATATNTDGTATAYHCDNWTSNVGYPVGPLGDAGAAWTLAITLGGESLPVTSTGWTIDPSVSGLQICDQQGRLYCFQQ